MIHTLVLIEVIFPSVTDIGIKRKKGIESNDSIQRERSPLVHVHGDYDPCHNHNHKKTRHGYQCLQNRKFFLRLRIETRFLAQLFIPSSFHSLRNGSLYVCMVIGFIHFPNRLCVPADPI
jgi:hypothetical protein